MSKKFTPICARCRSENLTYNGAVVWDHPAQDWIVDATRPAMFGCDECLDAECDIIMKPDGSSEYRVYLLVQTMVPLFETVSILNQKCKAGYTKSLSKAGVRRVFVRAKSELQVQQFMKDNKYNYSYDHEIRFIGELPFEVREWQESVLRIDYDLERECSRIQVCSQCRRDELRWSAMVNRRGEVTAECDNYDCSHCETESTAEWAYPEEVVK